MENSFEVVNNKREFRFEVKMPDGEYVSVTYRWLKGKMVLMHTFAPPSARGTGAAGAVVRHALQYALNHNLKIVVYCSYIEKYMKEHPEYDVLL